MDQCDKCGGQHQKRERMTFVHFERDDWEISGYFCNDCGVLFIEAGKISLGEILKKGTPIQSLFS